MEQKKNAQQGMLRDEIDYIDIPAFNRSMMRYARRYLLFVLPLILCMTLCLAILSRPYAKKSYVAGGTAMIGVRLSDSLNFDYNLSGLSWDRQATLAHMNEVLTALTESGYLTQFVKESMGIKRTEELKGQIFIDAAYSTNLLDIYVVSESAKESEAIRDALFDSFPEAVFPAVGFLEMDVQELYAREEASPRAFLTSPKLWAAGGTALGILAYLALIFLYTLGRRDVESPEDLRKLTDLTCLGRLPASEKDYRQAFDTFSRTVSEDILQQQVKVLLLTGSGPKRGQSTLAASLEKELQEMGKKVVLTDLTPEEGPLTQDKARCSLEKYLEEADLVLIDGPPCDESADALILADQADAMILVIREGQSQPEELKEMFRSLEYVKARPLGYVLNLCKYTGI